MRRAGASTTTVAAAVSVFLASSSLTRVYTNFSYLRAVIGAIVIAFLLGWVARRLDVPASLTPAVSFVGFVEYLTLVYFHSSAAFGIFPTTAVLKDAGRFVTLGAADMNQLAAPVEPTRALVFLTVAGVFATAVVVDLLALRLRRPVLAGLPLLTLFIIPSSLAPDGAGWINFALAATGFLALLSTEARERVHRWGRRLSASDDAPTQTFSRPLMRAAQGIGATAIAFALVLPGVAPSLAGNGLLTGTGASLGPGGDGSGASTVINPVVEIRRKLRESGTHEVMRVTTDTPQYLRMAVLGEFNGNEWTIAKRTTALHKVDGLIPPPPGLTNAVPFVTTSANIKVLDRLGGRFLPVPYSPSQIDGLRGRWRYDDETRTVFSRNKSVGGLEYTAESIVAKPDPNKLEDRRPYPPDVGTYRELKPGTVDPFVRATANSIVRGATTDWARVVDIQNYFSAEGRFTYSTDVGLSAGTGKNDLVSFLTDKVGYCEQFAAAMAVMVRVIGLPSRVVVGFTPGTDKGDYWSITNKDAHAWPEVYFPDAGWVRFEPTPPQRGSAISAPDEASIVPTMAPRPSASPTPSASAGAPLTLPSAAPRDPEERGGSAGSGQVGQSDGGGPSRALILTIVVTALLLLGVPSTVRRLLRRRRRSRAQTPRERAHVAWRHLHDDAHDLGFSWPQSASPRVAAKALIASAYLSGSPVEAVRRLAQAEETARYAASSPADGGYDKDVALVRKALRAAAEGRRRMRATLLPPSTLREIALALHTLSVRVGDVVGNAIGRGPISARVRLRAR